MNKLKIKTLPRRGNSDSIPECSPINRLGVYFGGSMSNIHPIFEEILSKYVLHKSSVRIIEEGNK